MPVTQKRAYASCKWDRGLDTGDVLMTETVRITAVDTTGSLREKLRQAGIRCLHATLGQINEKTATPVPQNDLGATYAKKLLKKEARISWDANAVDLHRMIRAFNPEPIAFALLDDLRIRIWSAEIVAINQEAIPGTIIELGPAGILVSTRDAGLMLTSVQLPIGKGSVLRPQDVLSARKDLFAAGKVFT